MSKCTASISVGQGVVLCLPSYLSGPRSGIVPSKFAPWDSHSGWTSRITRMASCNAMLRAQLVAHRDGRWLPRPADKPTQPQGPKAATLAGSWRQTSFLEQTLIAQWSRSLSLEQEKSCKTNGHGRTPAHPWISMNIH